MDPLLSRRALLAAGVGLVAATACGSGGGTESATTTTIGDDGAGAASPDQLIVAPGTALLVAGRPERFTAGILDIDTTPVTSGDVQFAFGRALNQLGAAQPGQLHTRGIESRAFWSTTVTFDGPGQWWVAARAGDKVGATKVSVVGDTAVPIEGDRLVSVPTATVADHRDAEVLCTREPPCPLHDVSLDVALREARPVALLFAAPKLCLSRTCGPVLDVLLGLHGEFADRVRFVHVEVYRSLQGNLSDASNLTDAVRAYNLTFEPILYLAGRDGVIRSRLDGPYDADECRRALTEIAAA